MRTLDLPFDEHRNGVEARLDAADASGRARAVDPRYNVVLEASAGTGKTRVLVDRYVNLLRAGIDPKNVLAITFTRKAATEMRERVVSSLRLAAERGEILPSKWRELRDRLGDIEVSTIDAFCLSLLREFPLEADLDPGFSIADEHDVPRLVDEALDRALRTCRSIARSDEDVALVFAQLGDRRARRGLAALINRRLVAPDVLRRFLAAGPRDLTVRTAVEHAARRLIDVFEGMRGGLDGFIATGPLDAAFYVLARHLENLRGALNESREVEPGSLQAVFWRVREYFLTRDGRPRQRQLVHPKARFPSESNWRVHRSLVLDHGGDIVREWKSFKHHLNVLVARGTWRMFRIADTEYRRTLDAHAVLDFPDVLLKTIELLRQMEEFAQSRFRLESRYHHVLVDEFQDTSRAQWELVSLLVQAWGQGVGAAYEGPLPPSIFVVGDRKQSIYGFRDADVALLQEASRFLESLRPDGDVRRSISRSFRSGPRVLAFVNDLCHDVEKVAGRSDAFVYDEQDRFPVDLDLAPPVDTPLGLFAGSSPGDSAAMVADEVVRLIDSRAVVRDRDSGIPRAVSPRDVVILFRTRDSHREYEQALAARGLAAVVHKGLGFFETDEIQDVRTLIWHFADPESDLRASAFLRSRFVRLSDDGLRLLAPRLARALGGDLDVPQQRELSEDDARALETARQWSARWRWLVDRLPPAEWLDQALHESAYAVELRGPGYEQARENLKKVRAMVRRLQNSGYITLARVAAHLDHLATADEANAPVEATDAVSLMTIHASKGLEFPVVFLVDLTRGTGAPADPMRVFADAATGEVSVSVGDFLSEADEDSAAKEREETKRLLYVALTRARDRLYLGTTLKEGQVVVGRGSLAEVLPSSILALFGVESATRWTSSSGTTHQFIRSLVSQAPAVALPVVTPATASSVDRAPLSAPVHRSRASDARQSGSRAAQAMKIERLVGIAVHRLLERRGFAQLAGAPADEALGVLRRDEVVDVGDRAALGNAISDAYAELCEHPDVRLLYEQGRCFHEVPFSLRRDDEIVRGSIDCLVRLGDRVTVLEFKTGRPRADHEVQSALYCEAARAIFPDCTVEGRLLYTGMATGG